MKRALSMLSLAALLTGLIGCCGTGGPCLGGSLFGTCEDMPASCGSCVTDMDTCGKAYAEACDAGCAKPSCIAPCGGCGGLGCGLCCGREAITPGPPTGAITYPYYSNRAPRDFLVRNPRPLGP